MDADLLSMPVSLRVPNNRLNKGTFGVYGGFLMEKFETM